MFFKVNDANIYAYTGGKPFDAARPTVVLIHGVLNDHSVWALQSRYLAHHGWNVLAIDLPGHCRSGGEAPASVEAAADFIAALLDAAGVQRAALVGHSWGSLIALEAAARLQERISHLALVGTAYPMKVSPALIEAALNTPEKALRMVNVFSRNTLAPPSGAGFWVYGAGLALGRRVLRSNPQVNVFHRGFVACDSYANGEQAMARTTCPVLFALGAADQMTPPKAAQGLIATARSTGQRVQVVSLPSGHNQMSEAPDETLMALRDFLATA
ncbi:alpha/beta fold hydrolase [Simplicispira metamorpha]|jgi:pimeloyl-ACP methyl ester carboxylesterase|uniref:Pimeloyl-ACP methyl ester carboxylesterase n=1 Tax=Simplicispira metamorpha TaxID=80881 RepID=A0A4R2NCC3_9BURK|nr:alpha/beta hydrolase [Simplicispira metamorpha]MBP7414026.1 alpha/beta hydrolase [Giesbergeria sp.]MBP8204374.1 alpha/beta hydrolase [Giesbergeria sp.]TCP18685.1 pimeloyl-ACP methyl ester carboxylesterase [Simplicispira metamorpha]